MPEPAERSGLQLAIKTAWGRIAFLVDDLELRPALQIYLDRPTLSREPGVVLRMGPHTEKRNNLRLHGDVFKHQNQIVKQLDQPLDVSIRPALPAGFYRAVASTQDLDTQRFAAEKVYYDSEPLLIVYGTGGDEAARPALAQAAIAASKSVNPMWVSDEGDIKDGVANHQLLYGHLKTKPDTAVTETDLEKHHLVLIGKAEENQIIRLSQQKGFAERKSTLRFYPAPDEKIEPDRTYKVALSAVYFQIQQLINLQNHVPDQFEILDMTTFEAMQQTLF